VTLQTFDRLSGPRLSRTDLTQQIAAALSLSEQVVDIALLLIEAQIDLRFKSNPKFSFNDVSFRKPDGSLGGDGDTDATAWCHGIVDLTLRASTQDRPNIWNRWRGYRPEGLRVLVESLQLSATLRYAAPYCIDVIRSKVEQRVSDPKRFIRLLHISDLHMVADVTDPQRGGSPTVGQKKHSYEAARQLGFAVARLQPGFDLVVATGDLTADGAKGSFETVKQYVSGGSISGENKMRLSLFGLDAGRDKRLLLHGNHDRFEGEWFPGQRRSSLFEKVLETTYPYPYLAAFQPSRQDQDPFPLTLLFLLFDSNLVDGAEGRSIGARIDSLSKGRITQADVERGVTLVRAAMKDGEAPSFRGGDDIIKFDPENSVRIALLHHHPVARLLEPARPFTEDPLKALARMFGVDRRKDEAMKLEGADLFLEGCFEAGIQLILFGHKHYPYRRVVRYRDSLKGLLAFCCPTTLELSKHGNGFHILDFMDRDTFSFDFYLSRMPNGVSTPFDRCARLSGKFQLNKEFTEDEFKEAHAHVTEGSWEQRPVAVPSPPSHCQRLSALCSLNDGNGGNSARSHDTNLAAAVGGRFDALRAPGASGRLRRN
jgi:3',5'-cyclic AMP phosphodiesterase CpdA